MKKWRAFLMMMLVLAGGLALTGGEEVKAEDNISGDYQYYLNKDGDAVLSKYTGTATYLKVPFSLDGYKVIGISDNLIIEHNTLTDLELPDTIYAIGKGAFAVDNLSKLQSITINKDSKDGVHTEDGVLYNGTQLYAYPAAKTSESYVIPDGTTEIHHLSFDLCSNLKEVIIPSSVTYIGDHAFLNSKSAINIVLKHNKFQNFIGGLKNICFKMASGSKITVKTPALQQELQTIMTATDVYAGSTDTMVIETVRKPAESLTATTSSLTINKGDRVKLYPLYEQTPKDTTDNVTWTTSDPAVCRVTGQNEIEGIQGGKAVLTGKDESGHSIALEVSIYKALTSFRLVNFLEVGVGEIYPYGYAEIVPDKAYANNVPVTWKSSDSSIATVIPGERNGKCVVEGLKPGIVTIIATAYDNGNPVEQSAQISVWEDITNCAIAPLEDQNYTGQEVKPKVTVVYKGQVLEENKDYKVRYFNNVNPGTATVEVMGNDTYFYTLSGNTLQNKFKIVKNDNGGPSGGTPDTENGSVPSDTNTDNPESNPLSSVPAYKKTYGDKAFQLKVSDARGKVSYQSSDKKVVTVNNSGRVTIRGTGYAKISVKASNGSVTSKVYVAPKKVKLSSVKSRKKKCLVLTWKKDIRATGYQIQYSMDKKFKKQVKTAIMKKNKITNAAVKKLKSKKKYYVRVRAYKSSNGQKVYGAWSGSKSCKVK